MAKSKKVTKPAGPRPKPALNTRPAAEFLSKELIERILAEAMDVLKKVGIFVENQEALTLLGDGGAKIDPATQRARLPEALVWRCIRSAPHPVRMFDRTGKLSMKLEGMNTYFVTGSAVLKILDSKTGKPRPPVTADMVALSRLSDALPYIGAQSTGVVPCDVPEKIADRYRLYIALMNSSKPIITGTFTTEGFAVMRDMLQVVAGGAKALKAKPIAIFDACASQPLKWSNLTTQSLIDSARLGIPAELISVPLLGATSPATLSGALVQHVAENLGGLVIHQLAGPGSPVIYGGSPAVLDMTHGTCCLGAAEAMMICCAYAQIARTLELPSHGYMALSDSKTIDAQAGMESGIGALMAALGGVNVVSGAGLLEFEGCHSLEKLAIDNEACGMAHRIAAGVQPRGKRLGADLFGDIGSGDHFLTSPMTLKWFREEVLRPSRIIDREAVDISPHGTGIVERARERVETLLAEHKPVPLPPDVQAELTEIMTADAKRHGMDQLPQQQV